MGKIRWFTYFVTTLIVLFLFAGVILFLAKDYEAREGNQPVFKYKVGDMVECLIDDKTGMVIDSFNTGSGVNEYYVRFDSSKDLVRIKEFEIMDAEK